MTDTVPTPSFEFNKWLSLPDETWLAILVKCSYFELHRIEGVCKKLQGLVKVRTQRPSTSQALLHPLCSFPRPLEPDVVAVESSSPLDPLDLFDL
jgi:hypothetical protein